MSRQRIKLYANADALLVGYGLRKGKHDGTGNGLRRSDTGRSSVIYVRLKGRKAESGNVILYLEHYAHGRMERHYPGLKLEPETLEAIRWRNDETMSKARRLAREENERASIDPDSFSLARPMNGRSLLYDFIEIMAEEKERVQGTKRSSANTLRSLARHIKDFESYRGRHAKVHDIDGDYINEFMVYLETAPNHNYLTHKSAIPSSNVPVLSASTRFNIYKRLEGVMHEALRQRLIKDDPFAHYDGCVPREPSSSRAFLTEEELRVLAETPCRDETVKRAFLFCCLTGLRFSDVKQIKGKSIVTINGYKMLSFKIKKTDKMHHLFLSNVALSFLPAQYEEDTTLFPLTGNDRSNKLLAQWVQTAGIHKRITFHCSRHTAATLSLSNGTPIAVVSRLLGHSMVSTTQIYAKIVDTELVKLAQQQDEHFKGLILE